MRRSAVVGVVAVLFGFVVVVQRGLAGLFDLTYVFVTGAGVLALVQGLRYANDARTVDYRASETGDPEDRYEVPVPGDDEDELITARGFSRASVKRRREFHRRLQTVAVETLRARGDFADGDVEAAVDAGRWTADPVAAWFLGSDVSAPRSVRLRRLLGSDVEFRFAVGRTVNALVAAREGEPLDVAEGEARRDGSVPDSGRRATARRLVDGARRAGRRRVDEARDTIAEVRR